MPLVETFEAACESRGYDYTTVIPDMSCYPEHLRGALEAFARQMIVTEAVRDGIPPNYEDLEEQKFTAVFDLNTDESNLSGFRFHGAFYGYVYANAGGSRLCLRSRKEIAHVVNHFEEDFRKLHK